MKRVNFFSGQAVQKEDLAYLQEALSGEIKDRTSNQYSKGVVSKVGTYVDVDLKQTLKILPFKAYTASGEQIVVPSDIRKLALDLTDGTNRELGTQGYLSDDEFGWVSDTPYIIVAKYIEEAARPRPHYRTREPFATRIYGGVKFYAMREGIDRLEEDGINPYITLAKAIFTNGALVITTAGVTEYAAIDATRMGVTVGTNKNNVYDLSSSITVDQHIRSVGDIDRVSAQNPHGLTPEILGLDTNAVPEHEKIFHADGFIGSNANSNSCFCTKVDARSLGVDYLSVANIQGSDNLHYNGTTINSYIYDTDKLYIALADDSGIFPDDTYSLFIDLRTRELGITTTIQQVANTRTFKIIYNTEVKHQVSPIVYSALNTNYQCELYRFKFTEEKGYTTIDLEGPGDNISNFKEQIDYRKFGSISSDNLQRNSEGVFQLSYPIKTPSVQFMDGTQLTSAVVYQPKYIDKSLRIYYDMDDTYGTSIIVGTGVCKDSTDSFVMKNTSVIKKKITLEWSSGSSTVSTQQGCKAPGLVLGVGTWHVFLIATPNGAVDVAIDTDINAQHCVSNNSSQVSPIPGFRYYRRIGSLYIVGSGLTTSPYKMIKFVTLPDSGCGVTTKYIEAVGINRPYIDWNSSGFTTFPVPSIYSLSPSNPKCSYVTLKLNVASAPSGTYFKEYLPKNEQEPYKVQFDGMNYVHYPVDIEHPVSAGEYEITSYLGAASMPNNTWQGCVVSYYDPRII